MQTQTDSNIVLKVDHVSKSFRVPTEQASGLKQAVINWTKGVKGYWTHDVLKDISFEVSKGDFFGIVGRNGSGKSTLLKIISKIYTPDSGSVAVDGMIVPFIELGVGFNPELTGRENVYLNGALLGFTHSEVEAMYDDIVQFSELEEFMDQKLKNYSSGMQVRLAFAVAIKAQGDLLILDEVLAVGDEAFQQKCNDYFDEIKKDKNKTVVLVTHDMNAVKKYCNRAILILDGEIVAEGNPYDVADKYTLENLSNVDNNSSSDSNSSENATEGAPVEEYPLGLSSRLPQLKVSAVSSPSCKIDENFVFEIEYDFRESDKPFYLAIALHDRKRGGIIFGDSFDMELYGHHKATFSLPMHYFNNSDFRIIASLHTRIDGVEEMVGFTNETNSCDFIVRDSRGQDNYALINKWSLKYEYMHTK